MADEHVASDSARRLNRYSSICELPRLRNEPTSSLNVGFFDDAAEVLRFTPRWERPDMDVAAVEACERRPGVGGPKLLAMLDVSLDVSADSSIDGIRMSSSCAERTDSRCR